MCGHRACNARMTPQETSQGGGLCPVCGKKVTVGVMHRVSLLADRPEGFRPQRAPGFECLIPLAEIIAEVHGVGPATNRVRNDYEKLLARFGSELFILRACPARELAAAGYELLGEAVQRMRDGKVRIEAGYDGQYGTIGIVSAGERRQKQPALF
jgi:PHP family Zn ribbon phosphoesterase